MSLLQVSHLGVFYGKVQALQPTSLRIESGQIVTVIGPNGAGKSTMLNAIAGALPTLGSQSGEVVFDGQALTGKTIEHEIAVLPSGWVISQIQAISVPGLDAQRHLIWIKQ